MENCVRMAFLDGYRVKMKDERQTDEGQQHLGLTIMRYTCFTRWQPCGKRFDNNNRGGRPLNLKRPFTYMCKLIIRLNRSPHFPTPHRMKINLNSHFSIEFHVVYCVMISVYVCRCSRYLSRALYLSLSLVLSSFISFICRFLLFNYIRHMAFGVAQTLTRFTNTKLANGVTATVTNVYRFTCRFKSNAFSITATCNVITPKPHIFTPSNMLKCIEKLPL